MPSRDEIEAAESRIVELLGACAVAPDDPEVARAADAALRDLDRLLAANPPH